MRHVENVGKITDWRLVPGPKYVTVELDYTTASGVKKTLRLAHCEAEQVRSGIVGALEGMPDGPRKGSFWNSLRRKR
jgi:hypothetical protein